MTAALTPELAIAYVRELSADVRGVVVLAADGTLLAGPEALAAPARAYVDASAPRPDAATRTAAGLVLAARTEEHAIVVSAGPLSLVGPTARDARAAVSALAGRAAGTPVSGTMKTTVQSRASEADPGRLEIAAKALISATERGK